jgi:nitrous oxidase accessory protein NosD
MARETVPGILSPTIRTAVLLLASLPALVVTVSSDSAQCGAMIVESLKLDHDLVCAGNGLIIGADGIRVDLNGHTIYGVGSDVGIDVVGRSNVSIVGGTIENFGTGVRINGSSEIVLKGNTFRANTAEGVDCQAGCAGNTIARNAFGNNGTRGIMLRGDSVANVVWQNTFSEERVGILLFGARDSIVRDNTVFVSSLAGIRVNVIAAGNLILGNRVIANSTGMEFLVTPTGSAAGNTFFENNLSLNGCGLKGPTSGNALVGNRYEGNGADSCS